jgi:hypothetical protein
VSIYAQQSDTGYNSSAISLSATTLDTNPTAPTNLTVTDVTANTISVSYGASTPDNDVGTITYYLSLDPTNGFPYSTTDLSYTFTDLSNNTDYTVSLYAEQSDTGLHSATINTSTTTYHNPPTDPSNLIISQATSDSLTVSYLPSYPDNDMGLITYHLTLLPNNNTYTTNNLSYTFNNLSSNTLYIIVLYAEQSDSGMSSIHTLNVNGLTQHIPPTDPTDLIFSSITNTSLTVNYGASFADNDMGTITYYLSLDPSNGFPYSTTDLSYTFNDLSYNTHYTVYIYAEQSDSNIDSNILTISAVTIVHEPPTVPTDLSFSVIDTNSLTVTYGPSFADTSNGIITYYLTILQLGLTYTTTDLSYTFIQLYNSTEYTVSIYAHQSDSGLDSSAVSITTSTLHLPPTDPTELTVTDIFSDRLTVTYGPSVSDNGVGTITYYLSLNPSYGFPYSTTDLSYTFTDLSYNTEYNVFIYAEQSDSGLNSNVFKVSAKTAHVSPTVPTDLSFSYISWDRLTLTYRPSIPDASNATITYFLKLDTSGTTVMTARTTDVSYTFVQLNNNTTYTASIYAEQSDTWMDSSLVTLTGTTHHNSPTAPTGLSINGITLNSMNLIYSPSVPDTDGATITYYLTITPPGNTVMTTDTSYTFTDLSFNTNYTVSVYGKQMDTGLESSAATITGLTGNHLLPTTPTDVSFTQIGVDRLTMTYGASNPDVSGSTIMYYLTLLPSMTTFTTTDLSYTFTDLFSNTLYTVNLYAEQTDSGYDSSMVSISATTMM